MKSLKLKDITLYWSLEEVTFSMCIEGKGFSF